MVWSSSDVIALVGALGGIIGVTITALFSSLSKSKDLKNAKKLALLNRKIEVYNTFFEAEFSVSCSIYYQKRLQYADDKQTPYDEESFNDDSLARIRDNNQLFDALREDLQS